MATAIEDINGYWRCFAGVFFFHITFLSTSVGSRYCDLMISDRIFSDIQHVSTFFPPPFVFKCPRIFQSPSNWDSLCRIYCLWMIFFFIILYHSWQQSQLDIVRIAPPQRGGTRLQRGARLPQTETGIHASKHRANASLPHIPGMSYPSLFVLVIKWLWRRG